jgi:hypothetical protein
LGARLTTLLCKKKENIIAKSKEVKTGCSLTESSKVWLKEGCFANDDVTKMV